MFWQLEPFSDNYLIPEWPIFGQPHYKKNALLEFGPIFYGIFLIPRQLKVKFEKMDCSKLNLESGNISYLYFHLNQHRSDIIDSEHINILELRLGVLCDDGDDEHISVPGDGDGAHHSVCGGCGAHRREQQSVLGDGG